MGNKLSVLKFRLDFYLGFFNFAISFFNREKRGNTFTMKDQRNKGPMRLISVAIQCNHISQRKTTTEARGLI